MAIGGRNCCHPLNVKMEDLTVANPHLIIGDRRPVVFQDLITQTEAFSAVIASWKDIHQENAAPESNTVKNVNYRVGIIQYLQQNDE